MNANFFDIHAAADFIGPGAIEVPFYQTEITDIVRRRGIFGQRIKQVPATGHPSRFFEETAIPAAAAAGFVDPRNIVAPMVSPDPRGAHRAAEGDRRADQLQPLRHGARQSAEAVRLPAGQGPGRHRRGRDAHPRRGAVERQRHLALDADHVPNTSAPSARSQAGGNTTTIGTTASIVDGLKSAVAQMVASTGYASRPTAIYANPVLLDLIDREMKTDFNVVLNTKEIAGRLLGQDAFHPGGRPSADPGVGAPVHRHSGLRHRRLPAYIVTEDLIEYHWLSDPSPRVFQLGIPGLTGLAVRRGEVRRHGGQGRELRALPGAGRPLDPGQRSVNAGAHSSQLIAQELRTSRYCSFPQFRHTH